MRNNGRKAEQMYCRKLLNDGWLVRRFPVVRFSTRLRFEGQDLFGADIVAKKQGKTKWVQVKSSSKGKPALRTETLKDLLELWRECDATHESIWWVGHDIEKNVWHEVELKDIPAMLAERE